MKDKSIKIALAFLILIIIYSVFYLTIHIKAEDKDFKTIELVNGIIGLILSAVASIYLFFTYKQQQRQNYLQNLQLDIQKQEIDDNKRDAEFNRVLDIIYRQLEISLPEIKNSRYKLIERELNDDEKQDADNADYTNTYNKEILTYLISTKQHIKNLKFIINSSNIVNNDKVYIRELVRYNLNSDFKYLFENFRDFATKYPKDTFGMLEHIEEILDIYKDV